MKTMDTECKCKDLLQAAKTLLEREPSLRSLSQFQPLVQAVKAFDAPHTQSRAEPTPEERDWQAMQDLDGSTEFAVYHQSYGDQTPLKSRANPPRDKLDPVDKELDAAREEVIQRVMARHQKVSFLGRLFGRKPMTREEAINYIVASDRMHVSMPEESFDFLEQYYNYLRSSKQ